MDDEFGWSVALGGGPNDTPQTTLAIAAPWYHEDKQTASGYYTKRNRGKVYILGQDRNPNNTTPKQNQWTLQAELTGANDTDQFGMSLSMSQDGTLLAIGAPAAIADEIDSEGLVMSSRGQVHVYQRSNNTGSWIPMTSSSRSPIQGQVGEYLGVSVALSSDGTRLVAGMGNCKEQGGGGGFRVYDWIAGNWCEIGSVCVINGDSSRGSAARVALSGDGKTVVANVQADFVGVYRVE